MRIFLNTTRGSIGFEMMLVWLIATMFIGLHGEPVSSDVLQTIDITENVVSVQALANLTDILRTKMKISESILNKIEIVALSDNDLPPFKLQYNQLMQPGSGVDRESICSEKVSKYPRKLCKADLCCKLIGFQYSTGGDVNTFFVLVKIHDQNDKVPQFPSIKRPFIKIPENVDVGYVLDLPMAIDSDSEKNSVQRYGLSDIYPQHDQSNDFRLHVTNDVPPKPQLIVNSKLDYERTNKYAFRLYAYDFSKITIGNSCSTTIEIEIEDLNDNIPKFNHLSYSANIDENKRNDKLIKYTISDPDSGRNGLVTVTINDKTDELLKKFQIFETQRNEGYLGLINPLDYENDPHLYDFSLVATDQGTPPLSSTAQVRIHLKDLNDNGPKIKFKRPGYSESNSVSITEGLKPHSLVVEVRVTDADTHINMMVCNLLDFTDLFYLDGPNKFNQLLNFKPYSLKTSSKIDRESNHGSFIRVTIQCSDGDMFHPITTNESLNIQIEDINDNSPIFSNPSYIGYVEENQINVAVSFAKPISISDKDSGVNGKYEFKLEDFTNSTDSSDFLCDRISGKIVTQRALDYETRNFFRFKIVAVDNGLSPLNSTATVTVNVQDLNDNAPKFPETHYIFTVAENVKIGTVIGSLKATDADHERKNKEIYYKIEMKNENVHNMNSIEINSSSGDLRTRKTLDRELFASISFKVIASNRNSYSSVNVRTAESEIDVMITITDINDNAPQFKPKPHTKSSVEFVIEQYTEGSTCAELPYSVHDADDGANSGQNCCYTSLENDYNQLFSLMADTPAYICLSRKPEKLQTLTVTIIARDKPANPLESLTSKISFPVTIRTDPNLKINVNRSPDKEPAPTSNNESKNLIIVGILTTVVLVVIIIIIIIIIIIRRCSIPERDCDNSKCYQTIDLNVNRNEGTKVNYLMSEQASMMQAGMSPGKAPIPHGYLHNPQYVDALHKTLSRTNQSIPSRVGSPPTYHQVLTNQGIRIIQNPNRFNDPYSYEWTPVPDDRERTMNRNHGNMEKMRSMSPTKSGSIHTSSKLLNEDQHDSGYQILNPFGMSSSPQPNFINYVPEGLIPCEHELSPTDARSLTLLNNYFDENNNGANSKTTPRTIKKAYFQTTFV